MGFITQSSRLVFILSIAILTGCASQKAWKYGPELVANTPPLINQSVIVTPFDDQRLNENKNRYAFYLIPLMPYGWQELNTPEGVTAHANSSLWQWKPSEDMAKAAADEVNNARIFKEAFFGNRASEAQLLLKGTIKSTKYDAKIYSYCLSAYGPALWWLGLPATSADNELSLNFKLVDQTTNATLWQKDYSDKTSVTSSLYSQDSDFNYSEMMKKIMLNVVSDLRSNAAAIRKNLSIDNGHTENPLSVIHYD